MTSSAQSKITMAFITSKNKPNVIIVTGNVNRTNIGLMNKLRSPSTIATITEVMKESTVTPGSKFEINKTRTDVSKMRMIIFIIYNFEVKVDNQIGKLC